MLKQEIRDEEIGLPQEISNLANAYESMANAIQEDSSLASETQKNNIVNAAKLLRTEGVYQSLNEKDKQELLNLSKELAIPNGAFAAENWKDKNAIEKAATVASKILDVQGRYEDAKKAGEILNKAMNTPRNEGAGGHYAKAIYHAAKTVADPISRTKANIVEAGYNYATGNNKEGNKGTRDVIRDIALDTYSDYTEE